MRLILHVERFENNIIGECTGRFQRLDITNIKITYLVVRKDLLIDKIILKSGENVLMRDGHFLAHGQ